MKRLQSIVRKCAEQGVSDIHITGNHPVAIRLHGDVAIQDSIVYTFKEVDQLVSQLLDDSQKKLLRERQSVDLARYITPCRVRMNVAGTMRGLGLSIRLLPQTPPTLDLLNLHPSLQSLCQKRHGLILFCGATGSGKTSTIAAMLDEINRTRPSHIITLEDPIEYHHVRSRSFVEQRELGLHFPSYAQGLQDVLRQIPDVIMIGELRTPEAIRSMLDIAESGHLVFATVHASSVEEALYRIINAFPGDFQDLVRLQLATSLVAVIAQRLPKNERIGFRVPLLSIAISNVPLKAAIRDNKLHQINTILEVGAGEGMFTFKRYLEYLAKREHFTPPALLYRQQFSEQGAEQKDLYVSPLARPLPALPLAETAEPGRPILADPAPVPAVEKCLPGLAGVPDALSISIPTDHDYENLVAQLAQSEENEG